MHRLGFLIRWTFVLVGQGPVTASHQMVWTAPLLVCLSLLMNTLHILITEPCTWHLNSTQEMITEVNSIEICHGHTARHHRMGLFIQAWVLREQSLQDPSHLY